MEASMQAGPDRNG